jgi:hypothetical protein
VVNIGGQLVAGAEVEALLAEVSAAVEPNGTAR